MSRIHSIAAAASLLAAALLLALVLPNREATAHPAPQVPRAAASGQQIAGMSCDAQEGSRIHIHQHLVIFDHGRSVSIPPNVGQPAGKRCIYWVHTHTPDGVIHIEAPENRTFTLGDFFLIWGEPLSRTQAATARAAKRKTLEVWVDGHSFKGDPRRIPLTAHADIVIEAGPPFPKPPKFTAWNGM